MMKASRKLILVIIAGMMVLTGCSSAKGQDKMVRIGISQLAEFTALDENREGFIKALEDNGYVEGKNLEIDYENAQGDLMTAQSIAKKFTSEKKDLIFAISTPSAQGAYNAAKDIPILISAVTDPVAAGLVESLEKPGTNVSGTSDYLSVEKQLELIEMLVPGAKRIGVLYNTSEVNSEIQIAELEKYSEAMGYEVITSGVTSTNDVAQAISALADKIDVLYVPTDNMVVSSMPIIAQITLEKKVPVIASEEGSVEAGALATQGIDYYSLGYKTGEMAARVLKGEDISTMPITMADETKIVINEDSLEALSMEKPVDESIVYIRTK